GAVTETITLQVVVLHFTHALEAQRLPREIFSRAPSALAAGHARHLVSFRHGPLAPWMILQGILPEWFELLHELAARRHRERRCHADVMQSPPIVVEAEQE